jgi:hypothetical protein
MEIRLLPEKGGDGTVHGVGVMHDTGSDVMTLVKEDLSYLGNTDGYVGWQPRVNVMDAGGNVESLPSLWVQIRLVTQDFIPWSEWIDETAIIRDLVPGLARLSGGAIRDHLYFGLGPGNEILAVGKTKNGMSSLLA